MDNRRELPHDGTSKSKITEKAIKMAKYGKRKGGCRL